MITSGCKDKSLERDSAVSFVLFSHGFFPVVLCWWMESTHTYIGRMAGLNPMLDVSEDARFGQRHCRTDQCYSARMAEITKSAAAELSMSLCMGTYCWTTYAPLFLRLILREPKGNPALRWVFILILFVVACCLLNSGPTYETPAEVQVRWLRTQPFHFNQLTKYVTLRLGGHDNGSGSVRHEHCSRGSSKFKNEFAGGEGGKMY